MFYSVRHITNFRYSAPVCESIMEVRMHPRNEGWQRCSTFQLAVSPRTRVFSHRDYLGNVVHHFDVPSHHSKLTIVAEAVVQVEAGPPLPEALSDSAWGELDALVAFSDQYEMLAPSHFAQPSLLLQELSRDLRVERRTDPLSLLRELNTALFQRFEYTPNSTKVDSPIDDALSASRGVCQDFSHVMIALVRGVGIPCRYVSGYLYHRREDHDRSSDGATHAWVEALLPGLGWVGFDPTNNLIPGDRHIRTAIGRDYHDVPPSRGVFKGAAQSSLGVVVKVVPADKLLPEQEEELVFSPEEWTTFLAHEEDSWRQAQQQQQ